MRVSDIVSANQSLVNLRGGSRGFSGSSNSLKGLGSLPSGLSSGDPVTAPSSKALASASTRLEKRRESLTQVAAGVLDAENLVSTAKNGLGTQLQTLGRIQDLVKESQNSTIAEPRRKEIANLIQQEVNHIDLVAEKTQFQGKKVLNNEIRSAVVQTGEKPNPSQEVRIELTEATSESLKVKNLDISTAEGRKDALKKVGDAVSFVKKGISRLGGTSETLLKAADGLVRDLTKILTTQSRFENLSSSGSFFDSFS